MYVFQRLLSFVSVLIHPSVLVGRPFLSCILDFFSQRRVRSETPVATFRIMEQGERSTAEFCLLAYSLVVGRERRPSRVTSDSRPDLYMGKIVSLFRSLSGNAVGFASRNSFVRYASPRLVPTA